MVLGIAELTGLGQALQTLFPADRPVRTFPGPAGDGRASRSWSASPCRRRWSTCWSPCLLGPALAAIGPVPLAAHFFLFYFGLMATITPPVANAAQAAAGMAGARLLPTSLHACRLSLVGFALPFLIVYRPELLMLGPTGGRASVAEVLIAGATAILGVFPLAAADTGYFGRRLGPAARLFFLGVALCIFYPAAGPPNEVPVTWLNLFGVLLLAAAAWAFLGLPGRAPGDSQSENAAFSVLRISSRFRTTSSQPNRASRPLRGDAPLGRRMARDLLCPQQPLTRPWADFPLGAPCPGAGRVGRSAPGQKPRYGVRFMNRISQIAKTTALAAALLAAPLAFAIDVPQGVQSTALVSTSAFNTPGLNVGPTLDTHKGASLSAGNLRMGSFLAENGSNWEVRWDLRNDRPHLIQGQGIAILPKTGKAEATLADVERALRGFMEKNADLLGIRGIDLRLDQSRSVSYGGYFWSVEFQQYFNNIPVEDANVFFRINHGNLIQFGVNRVADVNLAGVAGLSAGEALASATERIGLKTQVATSRGTLKVFPIAAEGEASFGERFEGQAGRGYDHVLAYEHIFTAKGSDEPFRTVTDALTGRVLDFRSELVFATVTANIYPTTNTDALVNKGLPFANVTNGTAKVTDASGNYTFAAGTATSTLNGKYFRMADVCGSISLSDSSTGNLAFGGAGGTDCTTPGVGGAGNTHSSRTGFYHLTNINRKAASFFPSNSWLASTVTANMNINKTCNAFWNGSTVNFYRSGGGCSNTGEIAAVFLHEWGHGMDTNTGGAASGRGSGEAVGDTFAFLETKNACIGNNFLPGSPCANCNSSCTGVRDLAAFSNGGVSLIAKPRQRHQQQQHQLRPLGLPLHRLRRPDGLRRPLRVLHRLGRQLGPPERAQHRPRQPRRLDQDGPDLVRLADPLEERLPRRFGRHLQRRRFGRRLRRHQLVHRLPLGRRRQRQPGRRHPERLPHLVGLQRPRHRLRHPAGLLRRRRRQHRSLRLDHLAGQRLVLRGRLLGLLHRHRHRHPGRHPDLQPLLVLLDQRRHRQRWLLLDLRPLRRHPHHHRLR